MATLELCGLGLTYADGTVAVEAIDLAVADGEFLVLVGPSGCGKSSVLRMIAGLEEPTRGDVVIDGVRANDTNTNNRDIAMVFQEHALYPHMSVAENISFPLRMTGVHHAEITRRVNEVAGSLGLADIVDRSPSRLSGGQQQRVALARAVVRAPRLLLMDEPMSNLDAKLRVESRTHLRNLHRRRATTTVFVTHDQVEAMALADRVAVMRDGRIVQQGLSVDIYERPDDLYVAENLGSPTICVVLATVVVDPQGVTLLIGDQQLPLDDRSAARHPCLLDMHGAAIAVGFRTEAVHRDSSGPLVASVAFTEVLGADQLVHATINARPVTMAGDTVVVDPDPHARVTLRVPAGERLSLWEPIGLSVETDALHFFDPCTGASHRSALTRRRAGHPPSRTRIARSGDSVIRPSTP